MRVIRTVSLLLTGALFFLVACGAPAANTSPGAAPAETPAAAPAAPGTNTKPSTAVSAPAAAPFVTSNLSVTPNKAKPGERVMVGVTVANNGAEQGTYKVVVKLHDGTVVGTKEVTLAGGVKENVTMGVSINSTGTHMIMIDKLNRNLVIEEVAPAPIITPPTRPGTGPAAFTTSNLTVEPAMVKLGELAMVSVIVTNTGRESGNYTVVLEIDGNAVKTQNVTLAGGASQNVTFPYSSSLAGTHVLTIGKSSCNLTVNAAAPEDPGMSTECGAM